MDFRRMPERIYSENPISTHASIVSIPIFGTSLVTAGSAFGVEHFSRYLSYYALAAFIVTALIILSLTYGSQSGERSLRTNERSLTFHTGGSITTLLWSEVRSIECETVQSTRGKHRQRVLIRARQMGQPDGEQNFAFDYTYGFEPEMLCGILRGHWQQDADKTALAVARIENDRRKQAAV